MGGPGSGNLFWNPNAGKGRRERVEDTPYLDVSEATRGLSIEDEAAPGRWVVTLQRGNPYTGRVEHLALEVVPQACNFGGWRWWFICPTCGKRRARLYLPRSSWPACRECHGLAYKSSQEAHRAERDTRMVTRLTGASLAAALAFVKARG